MHIILYEAELYRARQTSGDRFWAEWSQEPAGRSLLYCGASTGAYTLSEVMTD